MSGFFCDCGLFNDAVSNWDFSALNYNKIMNNELVKISNTEGGSAVSKFPWKHSENPQKASLRIAESLG